jgi:hypothetical protein
MSTSQVTRTSRSFDAEALRRSVEERDAMTLLALYAEDAELHVVTATTSPATRRSCAAGRRSVSTWPNCTAGT